jgi:lipopolysaccharide heptosyltransferase II
MQILIIQTAFIGDVILATPIIEKLHLHFPEAKIDFLLRKGNESLLSCNDNIRNILIWDKKKGKLKNLWQLVKNIRKTKYDLVVNLQRFLSTGILTAFSGAKKTIGFDKNPLSWLFTQKIKHKFEAGTHEIDRNLTLIKEITDDKRILPKIHLSKEILEKTAFLKQKSYICIAPTSVWHTKQFPNEKWLELLKNLPKKNYKIYLLGSPQDVDLCENLKQNAEKYANNSNNALNNNHTLEIENLSGKLSLLESASLIKDALMNYVNDSAPMHLASAVNAPTCAVFCATIPAFGYTPLSQKSFVMQVEKPLECRPCGLHGSKTCPKGHFKCAMDINTKKMANLLNIDEKNA